MTVTKTSLEARKAILKAKDIVRFSLENGFNGESVLRTCSLEDNLAAEGSKLIKGGNGVYTLRVHSNLWYEFEVRA